MSKSIERVISTDLFIENSQAILGPNKESCKRLNCRTHHNAHSLC